MEVIRLKDNTKYHLRCLKDEFKFRSDSEVVAYLVATHHHFEKNITLDIQKKLIKDMNNIDMQAIII